MLMPIFQFGHLWSQISLSILRFVTCFFMGDLGISWNIDSYLQYHHPLTKVPHHQQHQTWGTTVTWRGGQFMIQTHLRFPTFALSPSSGHCRKSHRAISHSQFGAWSNRSLISVYTQTHWLVNSLYISIHSSWLVHVAAWWMHIAASIAVLLLKMPDLSKAAKHDLDNRDLYYECCISW